MAALQRSRASYDFWYPIQVRWGDMDSLGHVNNAVYFTYSETVRLAFRDARFPTGQIPEGQDLILARTSCDYVRQLKYPDDLDAGCRVTRIGRSSLNFEVAMFLKGTEELVAVTDAITVWFDYRQQTSIPIPDVIREALSEAETSA